MIPFSIASFSTLRFDCHQIHIAPDLYGFSCGWWAHGRTDPGLLFGLNPTAPHGSWATRPSPMDPFSRPGSRPGQGAQVLVVIIIHSSLLNRVLSGPSPRISLPWVTLPGANRPQQHCSQDD